MTERDFHELAFIKLNIAGNVLVWHFLLPDRKWAALFLFVATVIMVYLFARPWQIALTFV